MSLLIGFLTFVLVVNCLFLMLLILVQLPKKDAGAGLAFGGGAADALFGAGAGTALTKATKYAATLFMGLSLLLSLLNTQFVNRTSRTVEEELRRQTSTSPATPLSTTTAPGANTTGQGVPMTAPEQPNPVSPIPAGQADAPAAAPASEPRPEQTQPQP